MAIGPVPFFMPMRRPTVRTASTSPHDASSISVTLTGSSAAICCNTGSTTVLLVQASAAPTNKPVVKREVRSFHDEKGDQRDAKRVGEKMLITGCRENALRCREG